MMPHAGVDSLHLRKRVGLLVEIETREGGGAGDRVGRVAVAVGECGREVVAEEGVEEVVGGDGDGQRKDAAGDPFGEADHVGEESGLLVGEEAAGPAEAGHDLVEDDGDAPFAEKGAEFSEEAR